MTVTILDFYADWCGPCKTQDPILEQLEEENDFIEVEAVDVDEDEETANEYQVRSLPTLVLLDDSGEMIDRFVGVTQKNNILESADEATF